MRHHIFEADKLKDFIKKIPVLRIVAKAVHLFVSNAFTSFTGSENYWSKRYQHGMNSGAGSYGKLAEFKAEVLNKFINDNGIKSIIEYGCGDGNQLLLSKYPSYIGFDVSRDAIDRCTSLFKNDATKVFKLAAEYDGEKAQLTLSLDVIYHLVENDVFHNYMKRLFDSSNEFVIIYSSNTDVQEKYQPAHVKHREFSSWIDVHAPEWELMHYIPNKYPYNGDDINSSHADFFIYRHLKTDLRG